MAVPPHDPHHAPHAAAAGQTELFPPGTPEAVPAPAEKLRAACEEHAARATAPSIPEGRRDELVPTDAQALRPAMLRTLLDLATPVRAGGKAAAWLKKRRVFKKTWDAQELRVVDHYRRATDVLLAEFPLAALQAAGLFNAEGHLRFYRHSLLVPWHDGDHVAYLQAFAPDDAATPPELSVSGMIPCPYNARLLDGAPGRLYLCAGTLDTLEFLEAGFPAVGLPRFTRERSEDGHEHSGPAASTVLLKTSWLARFRNKSVYIAFDGDAEGEAAAATVMTALASVAHLGVEPHRLAVPAGRRVGDWLAGR